MAIKYRIRWFDSSPPGGQTVAAVVAAAVATWGLWIAPDTCNAPLEWAPMDQIIVIAAATGPVLAGHAITARGGPTAVSAYVAAAMVTQMGIDNTCAATAVAVAGTIAAASVIYAVVAALKRIPQ